MFKKSLIAIAAVAFSASVGASAPYVGASLGIDNNTSSTSNFRGLSPLISAGYGAAFNQNIYLAGEGFANLGTITINNNSTSASSVKTSYGYGLSFIPGVFLSDHSMLYARAGVIRTKFSRANSTATGGQLGLGIQTSVTQNCDIRGEYDYASYNKVGGVSPQADQYTIGLVYKF